MRAQSSFIITLPSQEQLLNLQHQATPTTAPQPRNMGAVGLNTYLLVQIDRLPQLVLLADAWDAVQDAFTPPPRAKVLDITQPPYSADPTGRTVATAAVQAALDDAGAYVRSTASTLGASASGGASVGTPPGAAAAAAAAAVAPPLVVVHVPPGVYSLTHTLNWTARSSGVDLFLDRGAILRTVSDRSMLTYNSKASCLTLEPVLQLQGAVGIAIRGRGIIDGNGFALMASPPAAKRTNACTWASKLI